VLAHFAQLEAALRLACFATGARDLAALRQVRLL
jgi:isopentenyl diphosphate isomerase/L-lactate dehydrogenase-like FMN-dependent dehydrogenase